MSSSSIAFVSPSSPFAVARACSQSTPRTTTYYPYRGRPNLAETLPESTHQAWGCRNGTLCRRRRRGVLRVVQPNVGRDHLLRATLPVSPLLQLRPGATEAQFVDNTCNAANAEVMALRIYQAEAAISDPSQAQERSLHDSLSHCRQESTSRAGPTRSGKAGSW